MSDRRAFCLAGRTSGVRGRRAETDAATTLTRVYRLREQKQPGDEE
jgi:hypothetical protein